jgi:hypothetical protein
MPHIRSPVNGQPVRYDNIQYFTTKEDATTEIDRRKGLLQLCLRAQYVAAEDKHIIEGHYKSDSYGNPYVLRDDGIFRQLHTDKPATR